MLNYASIDVPFNLRHTCWFCGEPSHQELTFPIQESDYITHIPLVIPACDECRTIAKGTANVMRAPESIYDLKLQVKNALMKRYAKHLGIGANWTKEELEETELDGTAFKGFTDSAWAMYEIAKQRADFNGWDLYVDGMELDILDDTYAFEFEGKKFASFDSAVEFFLRAESLNKYLFEGLVDILGQSRFAYALKIGRLYTGVSRREANEILEEIATQEADRKQMLSQEKLHSNLKRVDAESISEVEIDGVSVPAEAIGWAISRSINNLEKLEQSEDAFFEQHEHLGGVGAFHLFNGLQVYLHARTNAEWAREQDPNHELWIK